MKALVFHGPGQHAWEDRPEPRIEAPTDVLIAVQAATVCGTDLHIHHGVHPEMPLGTIMGHEAVGTITEIGSEVTQFKVGDRVAVLPITNCGTCAACRRGASAHCSTSGPNGWLLGHSHDGVQAEFARIPFADHSLHFIPDGVPDEIAILTVDAMAAAYEIGVKNGAVSAGDAVVIIGDGPIGLSAIPLALLEGATRVVMVGVLQFRLDAALALGATDVVDASQEGWVERVRAVLPEHGADVVIEAVGSKDTLEAAFDLVAVFGRVANIGVHSEPVSLPIEQMWIKNFVFTSGMMSCTSTPKLLELVASGAIDVSPIITHKIPLERAAEAYAMAESADENQATKIVLVR
ncbi:alcohol dehydrogenase catalytic domain-containing protein [Kineococcus rhizosphaerae]|uniref:Alcohol dehydrogenase n=1 Tax=Kineococcus rhizosphaerae TaxID=559628 RepID=A0A2T0QSB5_9ACTN|nr:alcohol dehydrogenase catalytic domain-containing protein [Kineococcus rhizosphaerae]PRY07802.1 alcohol dehydrogenase [Kineococcus rhizosphaerae]